jgi:hypothetical protein
MDSFDEGTRSAISKPIASDGRKLAELALHVHGPAALSRLSEALKASQKYLKFQLLRAACSNFCVGYPRMALVPPVLRSA